MGMASPQIVGLGGCPDDAMLDHVLGLARGPRVLYVPTAANEDADRTVQWYERLRGRARQTDLPHVGPAGVTQRDAS